MYTFGRYFRRLDNYTRFYRAVTNVEFFFDLS